MSRSCWSPARSHGLRRSDRSLSNDERIVTHALVTGIDEYPCKPIGDQELAARIDAMLRRTDRYAGPGSAAARTSSPASRAGSTASAREDGLPAGLLTHAVAVHLHLRPAHRERRRFLGGPVILALSDSLASCQARQGAHRVLEQRCAFRYVGHALQRDRLADTHTDGPGLRSPMPLRHHLCQAR